VSFGLGVAFVNSWQKEVSKGVHQGLDQGERQEGGGEASIVVVREASPEENHM